MYDSFYNELQIELMLPLNGFYYSCASVFWSQQKQFSWNHPSIQMMILDYILSV